MEEGKEERAGVDVAAARAAAVTLAALQGAAALAALWGKQRGEEIRSCRKMELAAAAGPRQTDAG